MYRRCRLLVTMSFLYLKFMRWIAWRISSLMRNWCYTPRAILCRCSNSLRIVWVPQCKCMTSFFEPDSANMNHGSNCPICSWAIRNCGLMLFHALMNRMCRRISGARLGFSGASGCDPNMTISFQKYEGLTQQIAQLLTSADEARSSNNNQPVKGTLASNETEKVFPALEILAEKIPSTVDEDDVLLRELVLCHAKSTIWAVRDQSARVYASLLRPSVFLSSIHTLLNSDITTLSQSHMHGNLLCIRYALRRLWYSDYWRGKLWPRD